MAKKSKIYRGQRAYREACKSPCGCFYCTGHGKEDLQRKREKETDKEIINNVSLYAVSGLVCSCTQTRETPIINGKYICSICNKPIEQTYQ